MKATLIMNATSGFPGGAHFSDWEDKWFYIPFMSLKQNI